MTEGGGKADSFSRIFRWSLSEVPGVNLLKGALDFFSERLVPLHELSRCWGELRASSGYAADLALEQGEPQALLHGAEHKPCLSIGHLHLSRRLVKRAGGLHPLQQPVGPLAEGLAVAVKPYFIHDLHRMVDHIRIVTDRFRVCQAYTFLFSPKKRPASRSPHLAGKRNRSEAHDLLPFLSARKGVSHSLAPALAHNMMARLV